MTYDEFLKRYSYTPRIDKLCEGDFWTTYKGNDKLLKREVSIKVADLKSKKPTQLSLTEEFSLLQQLPLHPNIAKYEDVFTFEHDNETFEYGVSEYYPDGNISKLINSSLSLKEREQIAKDLLNAIGFLEDRNIVHCNIKPSNILIQRSNINGVEIITPKLSDFGFAKKLSGNDTGFKGVPSRYTCPDLLNNTKINLTVDLWSWAVTCYELISRRVLFGLIMNSNITEEQLLKAIGNENLGFKLRTLPPLWQNAFAACLEKEPLKRAQNTDIVLSILQVKKTDTHNPTEKQTSSEKIQTTPNSSTTSSSSSTSFTSSSSSTTPPITEKKRVKMKKDNSKTNGEDRNVSPPLNEKRDHQNKTKQNQKANDQPIKKKNRFVNLIIILIAIRLIIAFINWIS